MPAQRAGSLATTRSHSVELPRKMSGQFSTKSGRRSASRPGTRSTDHRQHLQHGLWGRNSEKFILSGRTGCVKQRALCQAALVQGLEHSSARAGSLPPSACFRGSAWPPSAWLRRSCLSRTPARSRQKMRRLRPSKDAARSGTLPQFHIPMRTGQSGIIWLAVVCAPGSLATATSTVL